MAKALMPLFLIILVFGGLAYLFFRQPAIGQPIEIVRAQPYLEKVEENNAGLRSLALSLTRECSASKECKVNAVFRHVVDSYAYLSDPKQKELIRAPEETIQNGGGDCEDFTILMNSMLEILGFKTYLVLTDDHAYGLVCDIDPQLLRSYVEDDLIQKAIERNPNDEVEYVYDGGELYQKRSLQNTFSIPARSAYYLGGDGAKLEPPFLYKRFVYESSFSAPLDFHVVSGRQDYQKLVAEQSYREYDCAQRGATRVSGMCDRMGTDSGIVFLNNGDADVEVTLKLDILYRYATGDLLENVTITSYPLNGQTCVVLDGTSGEFGYAGFIGYDLKGDKIVVDPETRQVWKLE